MNVVAAKFAKQNGKMVILDVGGRDEPMSVELLQNLDIISPNEVRQCIFIFSDWIWKSDIEENKWGRAS